MEQESIIEICARRAVAEEPETAVAMIVTLARREAELLAENEDLRRRAEKSPSPLRGEGWGGGGGNG